MKISIANSIITNATKARSYIKEFSKAFGKEITYVKTNTGIITFSDMSDEDAIFVANDLQKMTSEAAKHRLLKE